MPAYNPHLARMARDAVTSTQKQAFVPMPGGQPPPPPPGQPDPAMMAGDPMAMQGGAPPMDPNMAPMMMDPNAMAPPPPQGDPAMPSAGIPDGYNGGGMTADQVAETVKQVLEETGVIKKPKKKSDELVGEVHGMLRALMDHLHIPYQPTVDPEAGAEEGGQTPGDPAGTPAEGAGIFTSGTAGEPAQQALGSLSMPEVPKMASSETPGPSEPSDTRSALMHAVQRLRARA